MLSLPKLFQPAQTVKLLVVLFVLAIAVVPTLPNYLTQNWSWEHLPEVTALSQMKKLQETGLTVANWQSSDHQVVELGGKEWSAQTLSRVPPSNSTALQTPAILMLRPQTWHRDQPQVEWMDIKEWLDANGTRQWTLDSRRSLQFTVSSPDASTATVTAQFGRGWSQEQTYAMLQWYAWSDGGHPSPNNWFWADQLAQWQHHQRMPWVAVTILVPIEPLGDIEPLRPQVTSLAEAVQAALIDRVFTPVS